MNSPIAMRSVVVGQGHLGKRHAEMVSRNSESTLVAVCDIKEKSTLNIQHGAPFFASLDEMLASDLDFNVVHICTPNGLHAEQALAALSAGKHVVVEKPMGLTKADCEAIIYKALQMSKQVFCVMQNRYSPPSIWLKQVMDDQLLGDILQVQINCYWNRDDRYYKAGGWKGIQALDGGTLFTQFSHFIDIMYWLFGDIKDIQAQFADFTHQDNTDFEDTGNINFKFINGGMGCLHYSTSVWNTNFESSLTVIGSKGTIKVGGQYMNEVEYCHIEGYEMPTLPPSNPANDYGTYKGSAANHGYVIENVVDVLKGRKPITTNALEGMKVVEIIERIYALRPEGLVKG
ncbi:MAG: Gfo/Idh/MocA family protein [Bacteroidia bacterium]